MSQRFQAIINLLLEKRAEIQAQLVELAEDEAQINKMLADCGYVEEVNEDAPVDVPHEEAVAPIVSVDTCY